MVRMTRGHTYKIRVKRQFKVGGVPALMMTLPSGLLSFKVIPVILSANGYIHLLSENDVPFMKLNSPAHKGKKVKEFIEKSGISVLKWPAKAKN